MLANLKTTAERVAAGQMHSAVLVEMIRML
jgi:hypothetical protein